MLLDAHNQVGPKFIDALPTVMENWIDFGKFINSRGGKVVSLTPMVSVVLKHAGLVVSYHEHRTAPAVLDEHVGFPVQESLTNEDVKPDPIEDEDPFDLETQLETCRKAELDVDIRRSFEK